MKRLAVPAILLVVILALSSYVWLSSAPAPSDTDSATLETVTVAEVGEFFIYMPLYYAIDRGFFERNGLDVKLVSSGGDEKSVAAVLSGGADFGVGDPTFAAIASAKGQPVKVVASVVNGVPFWGVTKRSDIPPITDPSQLKGLTVATFPKPSTAYVLQAEMFRDGGLSPDIRQAQFGSLLPLLNAGSVDIVLELEPNVSTAVANGAHVVYSMAKRYPNFAITGVTVSQKMLEDRADVVRRFVKALNEAEHAAHSNRADIIAFAKKRFPGIAPEIAEAAIVRMLDAGVFPPQTEVPLDGWEQAIKLRVQSGDLTSTTQGDGIVTDAFDKTN